MTPRTTAHTSPLLSRADGPYLAFALLWASALKALLIARTVCIARDGVDYIQFAYYLQHEPWETVWRESSQHPLYPLAIAAFHRLWFAGQESQPEAWQAAAQGVNWVASLFATVAVYILARDLIGRKLALGVTLLFNTLPGLTHCLIDALSEGLYLAGLGWSLALAVHGLQALRARHFVASGLACGLAYWARPESAILAGAIALGLLARIWVPIENKSVKKLSTALLSFSLAFALAIAPYCYVIGGLTVKNSGHQFLRSLGGVSSSCTLCFGSPCPATLLLAGHKAATISAKTVALLEETAQGFFYAPLIFVVPGIFLAARKIAVRPGWTLVLVYMLVHFLVLWRGVQLLGYVAERYTYPITLCGLVCAGLAWRWGWCCVSKWYRAGPDTRVVSFRRVATLARLLFAAFVVVCLAKLFREPLHQGAAYHRAAGYWLRQHMKAGDNLYDPYGLAAFYSGYALEWAQQYPQGVGTHAGDWWIVLNAHERDERVRERIVAFSAIAEEAQPVFISAAGPATQVIVYHLRGPVHKLSPLRGRYLPRVR